MSDLPSFGGGHGALHHLGIPAVASEFLAPATASTGANKRKRRPAGTPDPGAEVVFLSPKTLMESDRYVCEICNQGFQRDQNLQMHRRRHKVPWKLLKKPSVGTHKRVYVCPERSCLHHNPAHALGDLVGIKKHYRRKHCTEKQWKCDRCSKRYAVQSDFKAHLKTCGTRGHCCECGRVFSRVESFIEHQDICNATKQTGMQQSGGAASGRNLLVSQDVTDRNSNDSPSQSSDSTQAMSFAQSGMSERSADSTKVPAADVGHQYSGRILAAQQARTTSATYNSVAVLPAWLMDRRSNELELMQPPANSAIVTHGFSFRTEVSSINSAAPEDVNTPSLQLSIGSLVDAKTSLSPEQKEALALQSLQQGFSFENNSRPRSGDAVTLEITRTGLKSSHPHLGNDLVLSIRSQGMDGPGTDAVNSVTDSRVQAATRRAGPDSSKAVELMFVPSKKQSLSRNSEMVVNCNPNGARSYSSFHEDRAGKIHHSESSRTGFTMRGPNAHEARLDPATPSRPSLDLMDVAAAAPLFSASPSIRGPETNDSLAAARRTRVDQARQASDEAQRELARADGPRREPYEQLQLQLASAERADAETELAKAQRVREHAQAELQMAPLGLFRDQGFSFCHSCKSAIQTRLLKFGSS